MGISAFLKQQAYARCYTYSARYECLDHGCGNYHLRHTKARNTLLLKSRQLHATYFLIQVFRIQDTSCFTNFCFFTLKLNNPHVFALAWKPKFPLSALKSKTPKFTIGAVDREYDIMAYVAIVSIGQHVNHYEQLLCA
jgi:hypothetical protein